MRHSWKISGLRGASNYRRKSRMEKPFSRLSANGMVSGSNLAEISVESIRASRLIGRTSGFATKRSCRCFSPQVRYEGMNGPSSVAVRGPVLTHMYGPAVRCKKIRRIGGAVLHQCIRPLIGACCAPGHHGYQRACVLISGQASIGPFGSPVFARARKTDPPFCLVLSQTSAGRC
jgi:hypothetical protein